MSRNEYKKPGEFQNISSPTYANISRTELLNEGETTDCPYLLSFAMVADTIVYHPTLQKLIAFLNKTAGRDKAFRLVQYLSRFLAFYFKKHGYSSQISLLFKSLQANFTFTRKGLRFLKPLNHLQDAAKAFDNKLSDPIVRSAAVVKNLAYIFYLSFDSVTWFKLLGLVSKQKFPNIPKQASWFWFIGLLAGLTSDLRKISIASSKLNSLDEEKDDEKKKALILERNSVTKRLVWDSLDTFIALNNLKFLHFADDSIGLAGTLTSIFGIQDIWDSIKA